MRSMVGIKTAFPKSCDESFVHQQAHHVRYDNIDILRAGLCPSLLCYTLRSLSKTIARLPTVKMQSFTTLVSLAAIAAPLVSAHGYISTVVADGKTYDGVCDTVSRNIYRGTDTIADFTRPGHTKPPSRSALAGLHRTRTTASSSQTPSAQRTLHATRAPWLEPRRLRLPRARRLA